MNSSVRELQPREPREIIRSTAATATILLVLEHNATKVRYWYRSDPFRSYLNQMRLVMRLLLSLRRVGTRLPVHLLASGERFRDFELRLAAETGVRVLDGDSAGRHRMRVPHWASPFHRASFAKLSVLSLTQFTTVVVLDTDVAVLRNVDELARMPSPSFVFRYKCPRLKIWEMNSGVMVLRPDESAHRRMQQLMNEGVLVRDPRPDSNADGGTRRYHATSEVHLRSPPDHGRSSRKHAAAEHAAPREHLRLNLSLKRVYIPSDPGDQSVWRSFYAEVYELPIKYNTFLRQTAFRELPDWEDVAIVHDVDVDRSKGRVALASVRGVLANLTSAANDRVAAISARLGIVNRG